uniref:Uncharacterized protein n=1 Tax=Triticum urartu TaxID=4572 RepID=A0A8R7PC83_TRIUA
MQIKPQARHHPSPCFKAPNPLESAPLLRRRPPPPRLPAATPRLAPSLE